MIYRSIASTSIAMPPVQPVARELPPLLLDSVADGLVVLVGDVAPVSVWVCDVAPRIVEDTTADVEEMDMVAVPSSTVK